MISMMSMGAMTKMTKRRRMMRRKKMREKRVSMMVEITKALLQLLKTTPIIVMNSDLQSAS